MSITLQPELQAFAEERARREGLADASAFVNLLLRRAQRTDAAPNAGRTPSTRPADARPADPSPVEPSPVEGRPMTRGERAVQRMLGTATRNLTADEIMAETRSEL